MKPPIGRSRTRSISVFASVVIPMTLLGASLVASSASGQQNIYAEGDESKLIAVLRSADAPLYDKVMACKTLAVIGTKAAVEPLANLLNDENLSHYARFGLEPIPDPAVDEALRGALNRIQGRLLIGVIDSIGNRRDREAVPQLRSLLGHSDPAVVEAAAISLGRIASPEAAEALLQSLSDAKAATRERAALGALVAAERLLKEGSSAKAIALYDALAKADIPAHLQGAGLRGAILARGAEGLPLLTEQLGAECQVAFATALRAARELSPAGDLTNILLAQLRRLPPDRQAKLISVLADRADRRALPAVIESLSSSEIEVRLAAVRAMRQLGDASVVPTLVKVATGEEPMVRETALQVLRSLPGEQVDQAIVELLTAEDLPTRLLAMDLAGARYINRAVPALERALSSADPAVRQAALRALGRTVRLGDLSILTRRLTQRTSAEERAALEEALRAACPRIPEREDCAAHLAEVLGQVPAETKPTVLTLLGLVGGPTALAAVTKSAYDPQESVQDAATQVLGDWIGTEAGPELLKLAKSDIADRFRVRALRGYIRIARQFDMSEEERLTMCREALAAATRDAERRLVAEVLGRIPRKEALAELARLMDQPTLREDAAQVAVALSEKLVDREPSAVAAAMEKVLKSTGNADLQARAKNLLRRASR